VGNGRPVFKEKEPDTNGFQTEELEILLFDFDCSNFTRRIFFKRDTAAATTPGHEDSMVKVYSKTVSKNAFKTKDRLQLK
jgi:hypothetical protein